MPVTPDEHFEGPILALGPGGATFWVKLDEVL